MFEVCFDLLEGKKRPQLDYVNQSDLTLMKLALPEPKSLKHCFDCVIWQHAQDKHRERSQRIPKKILMANFSAGLQRKS